MIIIGSGKSTTTYEQAVLREDPNSTHFFSDNSDGTIVTPLYQAFEFNASSGKFVVSYPTTAVDDLYVGNVLYRTNNGTSGTQLYKFEITQAPTGNDLETRSNMTTYYAKATTVYEGVEPTEIISGGTSLNILEYNGVKYWGKPFALNLDAGANSTITVERTSSPNQHASTGFLTTGSLVYYGDVLKISASPSANYKLTTFTVNGTTWTSGNTITVTSAVTVVTIAEQAAQWRTVWTGQEVFEGENSGSLWNPTPLDETKTFTGVKANLPTKVSGGAGIDGPTINQFNSLELNGKTLVVKTTDPVIEMYVYSPTQDNKLTANLLDGWLYPNLYITKIEQYY